MAGKGHFCNIAWTAVDSITCGDQIINLTIKSGCSNSASLFGSPVFLYSKSSGRIVDVITVMVNMIHSTNQAVVIK